MKPKKLNLLTQTHRDPEVDAPLRPLSLKLYRRMFSYAWPHPKIYRPLFFCVFMRAMQLPLLSLAFSSVINGPIKGGRMTGLFWGVGGYLALAFITQFTLYHRSRLALIFGESVVHDLRADVFSQLQRLTMGFFNKTRLGRIISRITNDSEAVRAGLQDSVFITIVCGLQMLIAMTIMAFKDIPLFFVVIATAPAYYVTYQYFRLRLSKAHRDVQESYSRLSATLAESVGGMRVTQGFVRQDMNARMWNDLVLDHADYNMSIYRTTGRFTPLLELMNSTLTAMLFLVGGWRVLHPETGATLEGLIVFFFLVGNVLDPIAGMGNMYTVAVNSMAGAERVFKLLDRKPDFVDPPDAVSPEILGRVEFRDLCFSYVPGKPVLHDVNFVAEPGQTVALVGHTGSGKSSIINLISKFYLPDSGQLLIDGIDIRHLDSDSLHRQMGIVLQVNFLFTGSILENIRLGKPRTDEQVKEAAHALGVYDLIEAMPQGFDTIVGERGAGLSLGQRQVVCFARAMLANPRIMILDEATSSVDTLTESRIQSALEILLKGRTSFVVAHRLSTIRKADQILVLDHGRIIERGSHVDLLATGEIYANLYQQFIRASGE